jgi:hypothetical protein
VLDTTKFEIIAVNIPFRKEKLGDNYLLLDSFSYRFKLLFAENKNLADSYGIKAYPTTVVVKDNRIIFRGDFEDATKKFGMIK